MSHIVNGIEITHPALIDYNAKVQAIFANLKNPLFTPAQKLSELEKVKATLSTIKDSFVKAKESTNDITITQQLDVLINFIDTEYTDYVASFVSGDNVVSAIDTTADEKIIIVDGGSIDAVSATPSPVATPTTESSSGLDLGIVMTDIPAQYVSNPTVDRITGAMFPNGDVPEKFLENRSEVTPDVDADIKPNGFGLATPKVDHKTVPSKFHEETKSVNKLYAVIGGKVFEVGDINELKKEIKEGKTPFSEIKLIYGKEIAIDITFDI